MFLEELKAEIDELYSKLEELDLPLTVVFLKDGFGAHLDGAVKVKLMQHILADIQGKTIVESRD